MGSISSALANTSRSELLDDLGQKLPKKLRKKLRWKKLAPILSLLIAVLFNLVRLGTGRHKFSPKPPAERHPASGSSRRQNPASLEKIYDDTLRAYVVQAEAYQAEIERLARNTATGGANQVQVRELATHVQAWTASIVGLAHRIEKFRQNKLISKDLKQVPKSIASLEARISRESDPIMMSELERTLANRRQQLTTLEKLQRNIQMAEVKVENTISMLGTIYSQILAGQSTRHVADYRRLLNEIDEEVYTLQDHLEALEEVKLGRS